MESGKKTIWDFFVDHFRFTFVIVIAIVLFGVVAIFQLPKESDPEVDIPIASVVTVFPGASSIDVEELVTTKIEDKLSRISGITEMTSVSRSGVSSITIEFDIDVERIKVVGEVKDAVDGVQSELPADVEDSVVREVSVSDQPFLNLSLGGPFSITELSHFAKRLEDELEGVTGISDIQIVGAEDEQVQVIVDKRALDTYGLSIRQVTNAISAANSDIPVGTLETAGERFNIRLAGRINDIEEVERLPVAAVEGVPVLISDIAEVRLGAAESNTLSRLNKDNTQSEAAVTLLAYKAGGGDITRISSELRARMQEFIDQELPEGVTFLVLYDLADFIRSDLSSLSRNGLATVVVVFLLLFLFLGLREAVMASIAIPLAYLMTFTFLLYIGSSINFMTLFSLILSLGILVDSAIVINEGLNKNMSKGLPPFESAKQVIREYQWPLIAGTLTTVFAFVPMLLTSGIIGEYIRSIPITISAVLISSLFVALGIVTTASAVFARKQKTRGTLNKDAGIHTKIQNYFNKIQVVYTEKLAMYLVNRKKQRRLIGLVVVAFFVSLSFPALGLLSVNMFPTSNEPRFTIDLEMPIGTPLQETANQLERIEQELQQDELIESYVASVGLGSTSGGSTLSANTHAGYIDVLLEDTRDRPTSIEVVEKYQEKFKHFGIGQVRVSQGNFGPPQEAPVVVRIEGRDLDELDRVGAQLGTLIKDIPGTVNVKSTTVPTNGEFVIHVNRREAARLGISTSELALTLRNAIYGVEATSINRDGEDVEITVQFALQGLTPTSQDLNKADIDTIKSLTIKTPVAEVPLSSIADIRLENSRFFIEHRDGNRIAKVTAFTQQGITAQAVFDEIQSRMGEIDVPVGYNVTIGGENEDINESFADMFRAMIWAVFLIASLLVLQFNSFRQSLLIMLTVPLALIGVFPGLALLGLPLSFPGIIGIVALVGIVVNNAIILIDAINSRRAAGASVDDALLEAGASRVRPIILTTITTMFGLLPLALTEEVWRSLGFAIIFGLMCSTFLTLFIIPILYKRITRKSAHQ